jgi:hypothetical protein
MAAAVSAAATNMYRFFRLRHHISSFDPGLLDLQILFLATRFYIQAITWIMCPITPLLVIIVKYRFGFLLNQTCGFTSP